MAIVTAIVVVGGKWANKEPLEIELAIGVAGYAIGISVLSEVMPDVASGISLIVLLTAGFTYGHVLAYHAKLTDIRPAYAQAVGIKVRPR